MGRTVGFVVAAAAVAGAVAAATLTLPAGATSAPSRAGVTPLSVATGTTTATTAVDAKAAGRQTAKERYHSFVADVAGKLGLAPSALDAAIRSVAKDRVAQALAAGTISEKRAKKLDQAIDDGSLAALLRSWRPGAGRHPELRRLLSQLRQCAPSPQASRSGTSG